mmetsp:Transcript_2912/g.5966  ORF Transcript_2912/g.5966 Transcript_2912/m.5966 type:complete len:292 (+) Transcript_2912:214-1089(+)
MVFFVCDGCNESLKKNQVDRHASRCSSCWAVTCVDCNVTFPGDEYRSHTTCVSEAERYERSVYRGVRKGETGKKGAKVTPQDAWNSIVEEAAERRNEADEGLRQYLEGLRDCGNVPRKEKQFKNFTVNSLRLRGRDNVVDGMWKFLVKLREEKGKERDEVEEGRKKEEERKRDMARKEIKEREEREAEEAKTMEAEAESKETADSMKGKKRKDAPSPDSAKAAFKVIRKALKSSPTRSLNLKLLRSSVHPKMVKKDIYKGGDDKDFKKYVKNVIKNNGEKIRMEGKVCSLV